MRWPDRIITGGLILLLVGSAWAFGGVHRSSFTVLETLCFGLPAVWLIKVWQEVPASPRSAIDVGRLKHLALPATALTALFIFQLLPLPPRALRLVAPGNYQLYRVSLPGWPWFAPYQSLAPVIAGPGSAAARASQSPAFSAGRSGSVTPAPSGWGKLYWRTLSIAPTVTASSLIEWLALLVVFLVVLLYPFGLVGEREGEVRFYRTLIFSVMILAVTVAIVGLCERAWWNGKLLWFFIPADWGGPLFPHPPRASGPFVDPDHFANYLAMALPMTVVLTLFPVHLVRKEWQSNVQLLAGLSSLVIAPAILLSLSRAAWIAAVIGVGSALALCLWRSATYAPAFPRKIGDRSVRYIVAAMFVAPGILILFAGPVGQSAIATRFTDAFAGIKGGIFRPLVWRDTLHMIVKFPLFGVGVGCWPELFPRYQRPPWIPFFFRETENDYLQFVAETGLFGTLILTWLAVWMLRELRRGTAVLTDRYAPLFASLIGALIAFLIHEAFDFSFRTLANALLFTMLLALALRMALIAQAQRSSTGPRLASRASSDLPLRMSFCVVVIGSLIAAVWYQDGSAYPYGVSVVRDRAVAVRNLATHPAMGSAHLVLVAMLDSQTSPLGRELLRAAVWLDPNDPAARDRYAQDLLRAGAKTEGLQQITLATYHAPRFDSHYYLQPQTLPWLLPEEQQAIATGFTRAIKANFGGAADALAQFYESLGRYRDSAELFARLAPAESDASARLEDLVAAGRNYARAGDYDAAGSVLLRATRSDPADSRPYAELLRSVYGPLHRYDDARSVIATGIRKGVDPYDLDIGLADGAAAGGDRVASAAALEDALRYRASFDTMMRLGTVYLEDRRFARATISFGRATELRPDSAGAWFALGQSYEGDYEYAGASKAYRRAQELAPANRYYAGVSANFEQRTSARSSLGDSAGGAHSASDRANPSPASESTHE